MTLNSIWRRFLVVLTFSLLCYSAAEAADWELFGQSEEGDKFYYDKDALTHVSWGSLFRVRTRAVYGEKTVQSLVAKSGVKFKNLHNGNILYQIHCPKNEVKTVSAVFYDRAGLVIDSNKSNPSWESVVPDGMSELLYQELCIKKKGE